MSNALCRSLRPRLPIVVLTLALAGCSAPRAAIDTDHPLTEQVAAGIERGSKTFDHSAFDALLRARVTAEGLVDYAAIAEDRAALDGYIARLADVRLAEHGKEEILALLINAYNALTLEWIVDNLPLASIRDTDDPWKAKRHTLAGQQVSLDFIEHSLLRVPELFDEPRIHFGVNCASLGCPPLRAEAYTGARVRTQLAEATRRALTMPRQLKVTGDTVAVNRIFDWFGEDFRRGDRTLVGFLGEYAPAAAVAVLEERGDAAIEFLDYDWSLNAAP